MAKKLSAEVRAHLEWLGFIQPTGLVVSAHALEQAGATLNRRDTEGQRLLEGCVRESASGLDGEPEPYLPDFETFARTVLGWNFSPAGYAGTDGAPIPEGLEVVLSDYGETLRPEFAVRERDPDDGQSPWQLLVQVVGRGTELDRVVRKGPGGLEASPHGRLERLLRATGVPAGVLFNGTVIRLVSAPRGESSGWMDFRVADMRPVAGRPLCAALRLLLSQARLLTGPRDHRLAGLLQASRKYQNVVSERLSEQVLHGLYELLRGFQSAHEQSHGTLLAHELEQDPDNVYRALLTVMLRLVFLLYAEERGLVSDDPTFVDHYSVVGLFERLREDAGLHPDTMDDRYGAWAQLVVLFRMVHDGAESDRMRLPARRGDLFSPGRFPFLEGSIGSGGAQLAESINPPLVPDGTIHRVLDKLLVLDGERISYRTLDVEQIGSVYETMMGFRMERGDGGCRSRSGRLRRAVRPPMSIWSSCSMKLVERGQPRPYPGRGIPRRPQLGLERVRLLLEVGVVPALPRQPFRRPARVRVVHYRVWKGERLAGLPLDGADRFRKQAPGGIGGAAPRQQVARLATRRGRGQAREQDGGQTLAMLPSTIPACALRDEEHDTNQ